MGQENPSWFKSWLLPRDYDIWQWLIVTSRRPSFLIGIDTGGTYTDAAVIAAEDHRVVSSAKALTTRGDLAIGVAEAMAAALERLGAGARSAISLVSVSTTLATNAVVEGHGGRVCAVLIGFDRSMIARSGIEAAFPGMPLAVIDGGHDHNGDEKHPLDEPAVAAALSEHGGSVEAFAIAAQFAVRNNAHECRARDLVIALTGKPVTMSSELSTDLDAPRRALTAVLNARLISRITLLIDAVRRAMAGFGLACPLMIVKGDGTLALAEAVAQKPIETVLSGPAASLIGARWLSGLDDFIMSDMGGTTTDLGMLIAGRPKITGEGAELGGWRTMVKAIEVKTIGLGGDSEITIGAGGSLIVGPQRVIPVSLIAVRFPETIIALEAQLAAPEITSLAGSFIMRPLGWQGREAETHTLSQRESDILRAVETRPKPLQKIAASAGAQRAVNALRRKGLVQLSGFTPSDAAHILDMQANWSRDAAVLSATLMARLRDMKMPSAQRLEAFAQEVWNEVVSLSARALLEMALPQARWAANDGALIEAVCRGEDLFGMARIAISPAIPIVAVGAPVKVYYGEVADRLRADIRFPEFCDVANAVGAATGVVARAVTVQVTSEGGGIFRVHSPEGVEVFSGAVPALEKAAAVARAAARASVLAMGAGEPEIRLGIDKHMLPDAVDDNGLFTAAVTAEAIGRPQMNSKRHARGL
jgi:N-methylhydantoinase A/oxoprolinase/acetone carboxylase beta subunit